MDTNDIDLGELLRENLLAVILISLGCLIIICICTSIIGILIYWWCMKRRRRRGYGLLRQPVSTRATSTTIHQTSRSELGLYEAMQRQRIEQETTRRETGLLNCQYYLRSNQKYTMESHLPDIGSRISKNWFMVRPVSTDTASNPLLLTMLPLSQHCRLNLQSSDKHVMKKLFRTIKHPYIHNIAGIDYIPDKRIVVILEPFSQRGSLKDLIYHTTPSLSWSEKYSIRRNGLRLSQIKNYGRQILEAVKHLHDIGFKPLGQIQSGNIYVEGSRCKLSGYDNSLLGYRPRIFRIIKQFKENVDSLMFGHLLFELSSGKELSTTVPSEEDYNSIRFAQVIHVIKFIFKNTSGKLPSIDEIMELSFFKEVRTSDLEEWKSSERVVLDEDMNALIYKARKGKLKGASTSKRKQRTAGTNESHSSVRSSSNGARTGTVLHEYSSIDNTATGDNDKTSLLSEEATSQ